MPRLHTFLTLLLGAALALSSFTTISCNGNGGSSDAEGEIYTPGGVGGGGALLMARRAALAPRAAT